MKLSNKNEVINIHQEAVIIIICECIQNKDSKTKYKKEDVKSKQMPESYLGFGYLLIK